MFFYLSKIAWIFLAPGNLIFILAALGLVALMFRHWRLGRGLVFAGVLLGLLAGVLPLHTWLLRPLEDRFPSPNLAGKTIAGIIVLGGSVNQMTTHARGPVQLTDSGSRMTEAAALALRFPTIPLIFTGGSAKLLGATLTEASAAKKLYLSLGFSRDRLVLEDRSRNTHENAVYTHALLKPKPGQTFILVTSAFHMPRSVGIFRKAGFSIIPYPAEYRTHGKATDYWKLGREFSGALRLTDLAVREWVGLAAYYYTGKTDALFPAP